MYRTDDYHFATYQPSRSLLKVKCYSHILLDRCLVHTSIARKNEPPLYRLILLVALAAYIVWLILFYRYHFIDNVNLVFHEAGHMLLTPFGRTLHFLGGTFGQLAFPVAIAVYFWRDGKYFEAGIGGVWLGESVLYMAEYMGDAVDQVLPLVGGGIHDWHFLFSQWGVLHKTETLSGFFHLLGSILLLVSLSFMYRNRRIKDNSLLDEFESSVKKFNGSEK